MKICPKCGQVIWYNSHFQKFLCDCGYESPREKTGIERALKRAALHEQPKQYTCYDCEHYEVCYDFGQLLIKLGIREKQSINRNTKICKKHFKKRMR